MDFSNMNWIHFQGILVQVGFSVLILAAFWMAGNLLSKALGKLADKLPEGKKMVVDLAASVTRFIFLLLGVICALGTLGMDVSALVASLGLTGFALGFALKDALSNFLAGILILFYQPFGPGDRIKVGGVEGTVKEINLRYTTILGAGEEYLVPNSTVLNTTVTLRAEDRAAP